MATKDFSKYTLYRWRYQIGYGIAGLLLAALLVFAGLYLPGGLSESEKTSLVQSASLSLSDPSSLAVTSLPYKAFQALILSIFGVSAFTIKLPSLIIALLSAIGLIVLLRRWFKPNVAVFASLIAISTSQFVFLAQLGTHSILYIFWPVVLLLLGTQITRVKKLRPLWKILFVISAGLSLYTPLSIYPLLAISLSIAFHPHLRSIVRRFRRKYAILSALAFILIIAPLVWLIIIKPELGLTLLGIPTDWPISISANALTLLQQYLFFWQPSSGALMTPVFGLGTSALVILGIYRLILTRDTTRSYLIIFWGLCLIPVLLLNPNFTSVTFVPTVMMLAAGFTSLTSYWYRLFPLNPYARITGLVPIIILVGALIISGVARYAYGYHYSPSIVTSFSKDLTLLPDDTKTLLVSKSEAPFYKAVAKYRDDLNVITSPIAENLTTTRAAGEKLSGFEVKSIITSTASSEADRFYVLEPSKTTRGE